MLACFAHPDDEVYLIGGVLAASAARGVDVRLVCATSGEVGEIRQPGSATRETLGEVRREELRRSCKNLGIQEPVLLGYRDSGMRGDPANANPASLLSAPAEEVVSRLVGEIRSFRPQVVLTYGPDGIYGHPDHITMGRHATAAFKLAGDPSAISRPPHDDLPPFSPTRLFYGARPRGFRMDAAVRLRAAGVDVPLPTAEQGNVGVPREDIHIELDLSDYVEKKKESFRCHFTQLSPDSPHFRAPPEVVAVNLGREYYIRAYPPVEPGSTVPQDFFEGLDT
jgi:LmbE family N-acetylglucosaminyl deacetylase